VLKKAVWCRILIASAVVLLGLAIVVIAYIVLTRGAAQQTQEETLPGAAVRVPTRHPTLEAVIPQSSGHANTIHSNVSSVADSKWR